MIFETRHNTITTNRESGFTLIEVLVAISIFAIGFLAVGLMQINAMNTTNSARKTTEAMTLAEDQAEFLRALPFYDKNQDLDLQNGIEPFDMRPELAAADEDNPHVFDADGPYTVRWSVDHTRPLPGYPPNVVDPKWRSNSMTIRIWVTPDRTDTNILAEVEFAKFCGELL